jgi:hypothetical protein
MSDALTGISTVNLELRIEALLDEIAPKSTEYQAASFGVNAETWRHLDEAVREYLRLGRNGRGAACNLFS